MSPRADGPTVPDPMKRIRRRVDEAIEQAVADGRFEHLPGTGRLLDLRSENPFVPDDLRMAFKIMQDAGVAPDWVTLRGEIETEIQALRELLASHRDRMRRARESLPEGARRGLRASSPGGWRPAPGGSPTVR